MQTYLLVAGLLTLVVGVIHSLLGEVLIFSRMRKGGVVPTQGEPLLKERHVRILWASWHLASVFGWALGVILLRMAYPAADYSGFIKYTIVVAMLAGSALVLIGTRGKHPGWVGLLGVAVFVWLA